jgi:hypothetical protein
VDLLSIAVQDDETGSAGSAAPLPDEGTTERVGSHAGIGVNNETLMGFASWLAGQPQLLELGYVGARNDHERVSTLLWWAGPPTVAEDRVIAEAHARGIRIEIHRATYSPAALETAARLVSAATDDLAAVGFTLSSIVAVDLHHDGLRVQGYVPSSPDEPLSPATVGAVEAVLNTVSGLPELMSLADIRVEHGRVSPC